MISRLVLAVLLLFILTSLQSQDIVHGEVKSKNHLSDVSSVHIINLSTGKASVSDQENNFKISASSGDTLLFSSVNFDRKQIVLDSSYLKMNIIVFLKPSQTEIKEVVVSNHGLTGKLEKDIEIVKNYIYNPPYQLNPHAYFDPDDKTKISDPVADQFSSNGSVSIISKTAYQKQKEIIEKQENNYKWYIARFGLEFFENINIPKHQINNFLDYCFATTSIDFYQKKKDYLKITEILNKASKEFVIK